MKRPKRLLLILSLVLLAVAVIIAWQPSDARKAKSRYTTVAVDRGAIRKSVAANGTLNPLVLVNVGTQVSGTIQKLLVDFNDRVQKGQTLVQLDPALFNAALAQSRANLKSNEASLKLAEANASRTQHLFERGYVPRIEWDQAIQTVSSARAGIEAAKALVLRDETNLRYSTIVSPVSGIVISRNVDIGQTVAASFQTPTLFSIAENLKRMQIDTTVAEADVGGIKVGQLASFTVDAFPGRDYEGVVRQIRLNSQVLQNVVTYNVVIDVGNPDESLLPGMTAFVNIGIDERSDVLRIPLAALRYKPAEEEAQSKPQPQRESHSPDRDEKVVYRLRDGVLTPITIRVGLYDAKYQEILSGDLGSGDQLVTEDRRTLGEEGKGGGNQSFKLKMF